MQYYLERQFRLATAIDRNRFNDTAAPTLAYRFEQARRAAALWLGRYGLYVLLPALGLALAWVLTPWLRARRQQRLHRARLAAGAASPSDAAVLYRQLLTLLATQNLHKPAWLTPLEFARVLPPSPAATLVAGFTHTYNRFRFGADPAAARQLLELYDAIEAALKPPKA
jgi:hypothetical protein